MTFAIIRLTTKEVMQLNVVQELAARTLLVILAAAVVQDFMSPGSTWGGRHQTIFHYRRIYKFQIVDKLYVLFFCSGSCYCGMQNVI